MFATTIRIHAVPKIHIRRPILTEDRQGRVGQEGGLRAAHGSRWIIDAHGRLTLHKLRCIVKLPLLELVGHLRACPPLAIADDSIAVVAHVAFPPAATGSAGLISESYRSSIWSSPWPTIKTKA